MYTLHFAGLDANNLRENITKLKTISRNNQGTMNDFPPTLHRNLWLAIPNCFMKMLEMYYVKVFDILFSNISYIFDSSSEEDKCNSY